MLSRIVRNPILQLMFVVSAIGFSAISAVALPIWDGHSCSTNMYKIYQDDTGRVCGIHYTLLYQDEQSGATICMYDGGVSSC